MLRIDNAFQAALKKPWKEPRRFQSVCEACCLGKLDGEIEARFYAREKYVAGTISATLNTDVTLSCDSDALQDEVLTRLVMNALKLSQKGAIAGIIEEIEQEQNPNKFHLSSTSKICETSNAEKKFVLHTIYCIFELL